MVSAEHFMCDLLSWKAVLLPTNEREKIASKKCWFYALLREVTAAWPRKVCSGANLTPFVTRSQLEILVVANLASFSGQPFNVVYWKWNRWQKNPINECLHDFDVLINCEESSIKRQRMSTSSFSFGESSPRASSSKLYNFIARSVSAIVVCAEKKAQH